MGPRRLDLNRSKQFAGNTAPVYIPISHQLLVAMITDPRVFENEYLPRELMHREGEVEEFTRAFQPALHGEAAEHVLMCGRSML